MPAFEKNQTSKKRKRKRMMEMTAKPIWGGSGHSSGTMARGRDRLKEEKFR